MSAIFVAEDDKYISRVMERAFRLTNHEITIAVDGNEAWKKLQAMDPLPAAILVDIMMPNMDGLSLIKAIRGDHRFDSVPVIVLTNTFNTEKAEECMAAGADKYLVKFDYTPKQIVEFAEQVIRERGAKTPA